MYLVNESSKLEPVNRDYKIREKSQSLLDHPRISFYYHFNFYFFFLFLSLFISFSN